MLADAGGGGRVATPWFDYALPQIWQIVNGQDTEALWKQASGWKKTVELTTLHKYNLDQYKEQLAQAWPPGRSEAASAYLAELDKLITSVQETHDAASANYSAVVSIALALSDAKYKLKPLYEEYQENERKLAAYRQQVDAYNSDATAMPQPSPGPSPVKEGRQEELNNQARSIMYRIGNEITTAGAALKPPRPYQPPKPGLRDSDGGGDPSGGAGSAGGGAPLLVPPVVPPVRPAPSFDPPPANLQPVPTPSAPTGIGQGPILGGTPTTLPPPPPPTTTPQVIQPSPPPPPPPPPGLPPGPIPPGYGTSPGVPPKIGLPNTGLIGTGGGPGPKGLGGLVGRGGPRPMPPGGVIGGQPGAGLARPGAGRAFSRVNPPGGVIGGSPAAGKPAARAGGAVGKPARTGGAAGMPVARSGRRREEEGAPQHWDPDNPWETEEGVAPVVLPPERPRRHDPGPAIGQAR